MKNVKNKKALVFACLVLLLLALNQYFGWSEYLSSSESLLFLRKMASENVAQAAAVYMILSVIGCVALALPGVTYAILAGLIFGPFLGTLLCCLAATAGASVAFLIGRFFLKDSVKPKLEKNRYLKQLLFDESGKNEMLVLMITRLVPIFPYNLQNFAYGITEIKFWPYTFFSFIFMIPGTAMYTIGISSFAEKDNKVLLMVVALFLGAVSLGIGYYLKKKYIPMDVNGGISKSMVYKSIVSECDRCGLCRKQCDFLDSHGIVLGDTEKLRDLAFHCFLCGECKTACPKNIDGNEVVLQMRRQIVAENGGKLALKGYGLLLAEKKNYLFRNYTHGKAKSILFPGCNFSALYPNTTKILLELLKEKVGMGIVFDCCGKPVSDLGLIDEEKTIISNISQKLSHCEAEELVVTCPNCYYYLKPRLQIPILSIYEKLQQLGLGHRIADPDINIFLPCPDRESLLLMEHMKSFLPDEVSQIKGIQCCGLGGCAGVMEPEMAQKFPNDLKERNYGSIHTYCASCAGRLTKEGCHNVHHLLVDILKTGENPDIKKSLINKAKYKFY